MKKKLFFIGLSVVLTLSLIACSDNSGKDNDSNTQKTSKVESTAESEHEETEKDTNTLDPSKAEAESEVEERHEIDKSFDYIYFPDNMRWGMAVAEVKDTENRNINSLHSIESSNPAYLNYETDKETDEYSTSASIVYCFQDNLLKARWCSFTTEGIYDYNQVYAEIKAALITKYGECESEEFVWTDTTYQNDETKWNDAFRYGYVTIKTVWHTTDSAIIIKWDYNNEMSVAFSSLDFESYL